MMQRVALILAVVTAIGLGIYAETQRREAQRQAGLNTGPPLATEAYLLHERAPWHAQRSVLLALEAYARAPSPGNGAILRRIVESLPVSLAAIPHEKVSTMAFGAGGRLLTAGADGFVRIWRTEDWSEVQALPHEQPVKRVAVSDDGSRVAALENKGRRITLWDATTGERGARIEHERQMETLAFSPSGRLLVATNYQYPATVWSADSGELLFESGRIDVVNAVFGRGDDLLVGAGRDSVDDDSFVHVWDLGSGQELFRQRHVAFDVAASADGGLVASGDNDGMVRLWSVAEKRELRSWQLDGRVWDLAFTPNGRLIVKTSNSAQILAVDHSRPQFSTGSGGSAEIALSPSAERVATLDRRNILRIWKLNTDSPVATVVLDDSVRDIALDDSGRLVATAGRDGLVRILGPGPALRHDGPVTGLAFSPGGDRLVSSSADATTRVWDLERLEQLVSLSHDERVDAVAFSPDGEWFVGADRGGMARVYSAEDFHERMRLAHLGLSPAVLALAVSPDSKHLATGDRDGRARIWVMDIGIPTAPIEVKRNALAVAFSPDGKRVVTGDTAGARIWDFDSLDLIEEYAHEKAVNDVEISAGGDVLATASADAMVRLWDLESGEVIATMAHEDSVSAVAFSPDGRQVASVSLDGTARVWDVESGEEIAHLLLDGAGHAVAYAPGGRRVATGDAGGSIRLWPVSMDAVVSNACARLTRPLSDEEVARYLGGTAPARPCGE